MLFLLSVTKSFAAFLTLCVWPHLLLNGCLENHLSSPRLIFLPDLSKTFSTGGGWASSYHHLKGQGDESMFAVRAELAGSLKFHSYRSLCGLLELFRRVNLQSKQVMHSLFRPYCPSGASRHGPATIVLCDALMAKQLRRWQRLLLIANGFYAKQAILRADVEPAPSFRIDLSADACSNDHEVARLGGWCHGLFCFFAAPKEDHHLFHVSSLELMTVFFNVFTRTLPTLPPIIRASA